VRSHLLAKLISDRVKVATEWQCACGNSWGIRSYTDGGAAVKIARTRI
jgi:hypothetical protein